MGIITDTLTDRVSTAASAYREAVKAATEAKAAVVKAERAQQEAVDKLLLGYPNDPKALGHNEATREAKLRELTKPELAAVEAARDALQAAEGDREWARIAWEEARYLVKLHTGADLAETARTFA